MDWKGLPEMAGSLILQWKHTDVDIFLLAKSAQTVRNDHDRMQKFLVQAEREMRLTKKAAARILR